MSRPQNQEIIKFILDQVESNPKNIATITANHFKIARVTANRYLNQLIKNQLLTATSGQTSSKNYALNDFVKKEFYFKTSKDLAEHFIWQENINPHLNNISKNIHDICHYGATEIINNVIDHSDSKTFKIFLKRNAKTIQIIIVDDGIGIFEKIRLNYHLSDARHALLELSKGKLTTDPKHHTGEGIFFTSRMFDKFSILSGNLFYECTIDKDDGWLIEVENHSETKGTLISLEINVNSTRTTVEVFNKYTDSNDDNRFSRTHVPVRLARYGDEQLVSRSQAKRILARFEKFSEVLLDFKNVQEVGRAFIDEIFRVFKNEHPEIHIKWISATPAIEKLIRAALSGNG